MPIRLHRNLSTASDITYTATSPVYTGSTVKPEVTVKNGDVTLSEGIGYKRWKKLQMSEPMNISKQVKANA